MRISNFKIQKSYLLLRPNLKESTIIRVFLIEVEHNKKAIEGTKRRF